MSENSTQPAGADRAPFIKGLGQILANVHLYGFQHRMTMDALERTFVLLGGILEREPVVSISLEEHELIVDGQFPDLRQPLIRGFRDRLVALDSPGLILRQGVSADEFVRLTTLLTAGKPGGEIGADAFAAAMSDGSMPHVEAKTSAYRQIGEDEIVVRKEDLQKASVLGGEEGVGTGATGEADAEETGYDDVKVEQILAFLRRAPGAAPVGVVGSIEQAAEKTEALADAILAAVEVGDGKGVPADGESLGEVIVGCLRRVFEGLCEDKAAKTQKGKRSLVKTLAVLEEELLEKLRQFAGDAYDTAARTITGAREEMQDELQMDALVSEYVRKRKGIEGSESRIVRFLKSRPADKLEESGLHERLIESGLSPNEWSELLFKSQKSTDTPAQGVGFGGGSLGAALARLMQIVELSAAPGENQVEGDAVSQVVAEVTEEVARSVARTESKIEALAEAVAKADEETKAGTERESSVSKLRLLEILAEIVQEMRQPLSVINCIFGMLQHTRRDGGNEGELSMLKLAAESADRIETLIVKIVEVAGLPDALQPDADIISGLYT